MNHITLTDTPTLVLVENSLTIFNEVIMYSFTVVILYETANII